MKNILIHLPERGPYAKYRILKPYQHCKNAMLKKGITLTVANDWQNHADDADVIVFHGLTHADHLPMLQELQQRKTIVWSFDDLLLEIPEHNPHFGKFTPQAKQTIRACQELADFILVTTDVLSEAIGFPEKTIVAPNLIDLDDYRPRKESNTFNRAGYLAGDTHWLDARILEPVVDLSDKDFIFLGCLPEGLTDYVKIPGQLTLSVKPQARLGRRVGYVPTVPSNYYQMVADGLNLDIGLAPLVESRFNACKSNLKWLEYSAMGIPSVCSNVTPYKESIIHGETGFLVDTPDQWLEALDACNQTIADNAFWSMRADWSWGRQDHQWVAAFERMASLDKTFNPFIIYGE